MYLAYVSESAVLTTSYGKPDQTKVTKIETAEEFYPGDQCRMDTMTAGILQKPRPACWFIAP